MDKTSAKQRLLDEALKLAAFDGWNDAMLTQACKNAGITQSEYIRILPNGPIELITFWIDCADEAMSAWAAEQNLESLKVRERIKQLVLFRLNHFAQHKEAIRRACSTLMLPWHAAVNLQSLGKTVDTMWLLAGDESNDYNWYTKRLLLSGVYSLTLIYWLSDESDDFADTSAFLDRRIENVMWLGGAIGKVVNKAT